MFTCPNPSCGRVFAIPLKTLNLQDSAGGPYPACPFCLTRIPEPQPEAVKPETGESRPSKEKKDKNRENPQACQHHLGYLSERKDKQQVPEDCIVCPVLVDCMLQKMRA